MMAVDVQVSLPGNVSPAELKGIHADLLRHHVHHGLGAGIGLRRAVASVGGSVGVVGRGNSAECLDVGYVVGEVGESCRSGDDVISQLVIGTVVKADVPFRRQNLAVFVAGKSGVGEGWTTLTGKPHKLVIGHGQS